MELVTPFLIEVNHKGGDRNHSVEKPLSTVTGKASFGLIQPFVLGQQSGSVARSVNEPIPTVAAKGAIQMVTPFLVQYHGASYPGGERVRSVDKPMATVAGQKNPALIAPFLVEYYRTGIAHSIDEPTPTVTGKDHHALIQPYLIEFYGTGTARSIDLPMPAVTGSGTHHALVIPQMEGKALLIFMRMLKWKELARAQSFPEEYQFSGTQEEIKKQIGNAVPRMTAKALCKAVLQD
jgi:DNA (cytosine-5)-methyltransferase 1